MKKELAEMFALKSINLEQLIVECETFDELKESLVYAEKFGKEYDDYIERKQAEEAKASEKVVHVYKKPVHTYDDDVKLACGIITKLPDFYSGKCAMLKLHKFYKDFGKPKVWLDRKHVVIEAYDINGKLLGSTQTHWDNLKDFHIKLRELGIETHDKTTWVPKSVIMMAD